MPNEPTVLVLPVTPTELRTLIRDAVADALAHGVAAPPEAPSGSPAYATTAEAAALLGVTKNHLEALRARGEGPPFVRVGRAVRYPRSSLALPQK
jgi:excisionase family DNA binding protein